VRRTQGLSPLAPSALWEKLPQGHSEHATLEVIQASEALEYLIEVDELIQKREGFSKFLNSIFRGVSHPVIETDSQIVHELGQHIRSQRTKAT